MKKTVIKNVSIVNEGKIFVADVLLKNGHIDRIASAIVVGGVVDEVNGEGKYLLPGIIDDQVHFREPGLTHKGSIYSESKAAIAGGVTSFMEMPNTIPPAITHDLLEQKYRAAQITSLANYSFYLGTSNNNLEEVKRTNPKSVCGVKIFMGSSTGKLVVDSPVALESIFRYSPVLIATHCETDSLIEQNAEIVRRQFGDAIPMSCHPVIRDEIQCYQSTQLATALAKRYHSRLHVLHISTAEELSLFNNSIAAGQKLITAEACVHHLWFDSSDYERLGSKIKCNPAIKDSRHKKEILNAVLDNRIDVIATDHAPHTLEEKLSKTESGTFNYFKSPSGLPLVQHSLNVMLELFLRGKISLEKIAEKMCHSPAEIFQVKDRGFIREGYSADLLLLDLKQAYEVARNNILYQCGWSPFEDYTFHGKVTHTWVNGRLVYKDGVFDESINGMRLEFDRSH